LDFNLLGDSRFILCDRLVLKKHLANHNGEK